MSAVTVTVCRHCGKDSEPLEVCARCRGRRRVGKSEHGGDSSKGMGWANYSLVPCPECNDPKNPEDAEPGDWQES